MTAPAATVPAMQVAPSRETLHLWGAPAAGKTGLLGALYATSKSREPDRWEAHPKDCRDAYTQEQLLDAYEQLVDRAVAKTDVRKDGYRPLEFLLRQFRKGAPTGDTLRLSIVDPAGEYSTRAELGNTEHGRALFARVAGGGGLLWLFNATADGAAPDRLVVLRHLVALLEQGGGPQLGVPVGLCLSKVDALPPARRAAALADPRAALLEHLGPTTLTWFEAACPRLRCFAISSAGTEPGRVEPVGLLPTLSWFAAEIGAARAAEEQRAAAVAPPPPPDDPFSTIEVPAVRPPTARASARRAAAPAGGAGGLLGALAARLASAGAVPELRPPQMVALGEPDEEPDEEPSAGPGAGGAATIAMPAVSRDALHFAPPSAPPADFAPRALLAEGPAALRGASPAPVDDAGDDAGDHDVEDAAWDALPFRARLARAAVGGALALAALGAGAWAGRAAIVAAGQRWQPPDAPAAAESPAARRFRQELERDEGRGSARDAERDGARDSEREALLRDLREAAGDGGEVAPLESAADAVDLGTLRFDTIRVPGPRDLPLLP